MHLCHQLLPSPHRQLPPSGVYAIFFTNILALITLCSFEMISKMTVTVLIQGQVGGWAGAAHTKDHHMFVPTMPSNPHICSQMTKIVLQTYLCALEQIGKSQIQDHKKRKEKKITNSLPTMLRASGWRGVRSSVTASRGGTLAWRSGSGATAAISIASRGCSAPLRSTTLRYNPALTPSWSRPFASIFISLLFVYL